MLFVFRLIVLFILIISGWISLNLEEISTGASITYLMSGTFLLLSFLIERGGIQ